MFPEMRILSSGLRFSIAHAAKMAAAAATTAMSIFFAFIRYLVVVGSGSR